MLPFIFAYDCAAVCVCVSEPRPPPCQRLCMCEVHANCDTIPQISKVLRLAFSL